MSDFLGIPSRLVGAIGGDAPFAGLSADYHRQCAPLGMIALLDGAVEGIEVDVHDEMGHGADID